MRLVFGRSLFVASVVFAAALGIGALAGAPAQAQQNPCPSQWAGDGDCDEPNGLGLCDWGTDPIDCSNPYANYGSGAGFSAGVYSTPAPQPTQLYNPCPYNNDGDCDEPNGLNLCAWGTDAADCSNPYANYGNGPGYSAGIYSTPAPQPQPAPQPAQPVYGGGSTGSYVSSGGGGSYGCPNYSIQNTAFGEGTLQAGGAINPIRVPRITAGGRHALANCFPGTGWRGYTITRPDYRFFYQGTAPYGRITFSLISDATDTVLLINTPDGRWHFNDDSNGSFNSTLTFSPALQGQYDIWAGSYNLSSNNPAQLWISEQ